MKCVRNDFKCLNRDVALTALNFSDMSAIQAGKITKLILGPTPLQAKPSDVPSHLLLNVLHSQQSEVLWLYPYRL